MTTRIASPNRLDRFALVLITAMLGCLGVAFAPSMFCAGLLQGAILMAIYGAFTNTSELLMYAPMLAAFPFIGYPFGVAVQRLTPHTIDAFLSSIDFGIGLQAYDWTLAHPAWHQVLVWSYVEIGLVGAIAICISPRRRELFAACAIGALTAPIFYVLFPAVGPALPASAGRNCIPSMHTAWALMFWHYSSRETAPFFFVFLLLTLAATLGLGEHYLIDLVAALPFTAAVCWLASRYPAEIRAPAIPTP